jgi:hypothetical protein
MNNRSKEIQYRAILARFAGNHKQAFMYALSLCLAYPHLVAEYGSYVWETEESI